MTSAVFAGVRDILAGPDWEPVTVTDHGAFFTISGYFRSMAHTGSRKDWESLARDLDRIAREQFDALMGKAEPAAEVAPEPEPEPEPELVAEPPPPPEPDPRDAELEAMRAKIEALEADKRELAARELELKDANASLKDALSDIEDRIADLDTPSEEHKFPAPHEKLTDWDVVGDVPAWLVGDQYVREGEDMDERIRRLTGEFKARVNVLNNFLLDASITPEQEAELADKQAKYHELAELGDRS